MVETAEFERDLLGRLVQNIKPSKAAIFSGSNFQMSASHGIEVDQTELNLALVQKVIKTQGPVSDKVHKRQLAAPYKDTEGNVLGVMYVEIAAPRRLKFRDLAILQGLGRQMVERHWQPSKETAKELSAETRGDVARFARSTLSIVSSVLKPQRLLILVRLLGDPTIVASRGFDDIRELSAVPFSLDMVNDVWEKGDTCHIGDALNDPAYSKFAGVSEHNIRSVCICPLNKLDGEDRGLIYLDSCKDASEFLTAEVSILKRLALALEKDLAKVLAPEPEDDSASVLGTPAESILDNDNEYALPDVGLPPSTPKDEAEAKVEVPEIARPQMAVVKAVADLDEPKIDSEAIEFEDSDSAEVNDDSQVIESYAEGHLDQPDETEYRDESYSSRPTMPEMGEVKAVAEIEAPALLGSETVEPESEELTAEFDEEVPDQAEILAEAEIDEAESEEITEFAEAELEDDDRVDQPGLEQELAEAEDLAPEPEEITAEAEFEEDSVDEPEVDQELAETADLAPEPEEYAKDDEEDSDDETDQPEEVEEFAEIDEPEPEEAQEQAEAEELDPEPEEITEFAEAELEEDDSVDEPEVDQELAETADLAPEPEEYAKDDEEDSDNETDQPEEVEEFAEINEPEPEEAQEQAEAEELDPEPEEITEFAEAELEEDDSVDEPEVDQELAEAEDLAPEPEEVTEDDEEDSDDETDQPEEVEEFAEIDEPEPEEAQEQAEAEELDPEPEETTEFAEAELEEDDSVDEPEEDQELAETEDLAPEPEEVTEDGEEDSDDETDQPEEVEEFAEIDEPEPEPEDAEELDPEPEEITEFAEAELEEDDSVDEPEEDQELAETEDLEPEPEEVAEVNEEESEVDVAEDSDEPDEAVIDQASSSTGPTSDAAEVEEDDSDVLTITVPREDETEVGDDAVEPTIEETAPALRKPVDEEVDAVRAMPVDSTLEVSADIAARALAGVRDAANVKEEESSGEEPETKASESRAELPTREPRMPEAEPEAKTEPDSEPEAEPKPEAEPEPQAKAEAEPQAEPEPQAEAEAEKSKPRKPEPTDDTVEVGSRMQHIEKGLQSVAPAKKATFWERLKWVFLPKAVPNGGGNYSHVHVSGTVVLQGDWNGDEPIEVVLKFPTRNLRVILELGKNDNNYSYHGRFEGQCPVYFELMVEKPGYSPVKLSKVPFVTGDGEPSAQVAEITLIPKTR